MARRRRRTDKSGAWIAEGGRGLRARRWRWYLDETIVNEGPRWRVRGRYASRERAIGAIMLSILNTLPDPWRALDGWWIREKAVDRFSAWSSTKHKAVESWIDEYGKKHADEYERSKEKKVKAPEDVNVDGDLRALRRFDNGAKRTPWYRWLRGGRLGKVEIYLQATIGFAGWYGGAFNAKCTTAGFYRVGTGEAEARTVMQHKKRMDWWTGHDKLAAGAVLLIQHETKRRAVRRGSRGRRVAGKRSSPRR